MDKLTSLIIGTSILGLNSSKTLLVFISKPIKLPIEEKFETWLLLEAIQLKDKILSPLFSLQKKSRLVLAQ